MSASWLRFDRACERKITRTEGISVRVMTRTEGISVGVRITRTEGISVRVITRTEGISVRVIRMLCQLVGFGPIERASVKSDVFF